MLRAYANNRVCGDAPRRCIGVSGCRGTGGYQGIGVSEAGEAGEDGDAGRGGHGGHESRTGKGGCVSELPQNNFFLRRRRWKVRGRVHDVRCSERCRSLSLLVVAAQPWLRHHQAVVTELQTELEELLRTTVAAKARAEDAESRAAAAELQVNTTCINSPAAAATAFVTSNLEDSDTVTPHHGRQEWKPGWCLLIHADASLSL